MDLFNFGKTKNNGVSEETAKAYWEFKQQERLSWPTTEEVIKAIIGLIPESQLKKLEIVGTSGRKVTFERQLFLKYKGLHPIAKLEKIIETIKSSLDKNQYLFELPNPRIIYIFIKDICDDFFSKNI